MDRVRCLCSQATNVDSARMNVLAWSCYGELFRLVSHSATRFTKRLST